MLKPLLATAGRQNWLRLGVRRRIVNSLFPLNKVSTCPFETRIHGYRYRGDLANAQDWHHYFFGGYELKELALISEALLQIKGAIALDVGANLGGHSLVMSKYADSVLSFEPYRPLADSIRQQIELNGIKNITVHEFGLSDEDDLLPYYLDGESRNQSTGSFLPEHSGAPEAAQLRLRKGDDVCRGLHVDLVKIDVEGYEAHVLKGLQHTLRESEPLVVMEITESSWSRSSCGSPFCTSRSIADGRATPGAARQRHP